MLKRPQVLKGQTWSKWSVVVVIVTIVVVVALRQVAVVVKVLG
jgi:hypothetical protein